MALPNITGTDLNFNDAVPGATTYQVQRSGDEFGLIGWENIGSPVATSPFDFSAYMLTKAMYLRVVPMNGAVIVTYPSDAVFYDRNFGSADPASASALNLKKSFHKLIHENIGVVGQEIIFDGHPQGPKALKIDDSRIDYGDTEFDPDDKTVWMRVDPLIGQGTQLYTGQFQISCMQREPHDRFNSLVEELADLVVAGLNVSGAPLYDFSQGAGAIQVVTCGMSGTPLHFAPRCRIRGQPILLDTEVTMLPLTFTLYLYREAAVP